MSRKKTIKYIITSGCSEKGKRLESWWKSKGWSKAEFARRMRIWPQNVNKYFSGELDPTNLVEPLMKEGCDVVWIIDGKSSETGKHGIVAESTAAYGATTVIPSDRASVKTKDRLQKLKILLESDPERSDEEMLDLLIKNMEDKQKKKGKM